MMENNVKFVDFSKFCRSCKHWNDGKEDDICDECLEVSGREGTEKPERFEEN